MKIEEQVAATLSKKSGVAVTAQDYMDWLEGGKNYNKFDQAVMKVITESQMRALEYMARVDDGLQFVLGLSKGIPKECGGVNVAYIMKHN